jgi:transcriptional regulator with XRE-family HTH domain
VKKLRIENGDTIDTLAEKLEFSFRGLGKIERGERNVKIETLEEICKIYTTPLSYFFWSIR